MSLSLAPAPEASATSVPPDWVKLMQEGYYSNTMLKVLHSETSDADLAQSEQILHIYNQLYDGVGLRAAGVEDQVIREHLLHGKDFWEARTVICRWHRDKKSFELALGIIAALGFALIAGGLFIPTTWIVVKLGAALFLGAGGGFVWRISKSIEKECSQSFERIKSEYAYGLREDFKKLFIDNTVRFAN